MAVYRILLPETYDCRANDINEALVKFHNRLTHLLNGGYDLDTEVFEVSDGMDVNFEELDLFAE